MRVNVYSQELITEPLEQRQCGQYPEPLPITALVAPASIPHTGIVYSAVRLYLHSPHQLHSTTEDDDRSAITFWLPRSPERREYVARCFEDMAAWIRKAPAETGLD